MAIKNVKLKNGDDILYPKTKVSNILNEDGTTWEEKVIEANPSGEATADLTKIKIADTIYKLASSSSGSSGGDSGSSGGSGSGVETLVLNEADFMTIMSLIEGGESGESIPTKGRLTGSYEMKPYGLIQGTAEGMTMTLQVSGGMSMPPMATMLEIMLFVDNSLMIITLQYSAMGDSDSYWSYEKQSYTLTSAS